ncbi:hypothetical protein AWC38_SpisGene21310 [Stylophora pistillata]|uniref:Uncharacterized protein n=1 Tax=Stylophora pistillata TaxID=50429 RepID=A0A2B4R856_STYPI|nr:hypothetical protein AWC38_SpisGene21310 [Stylophora pistillata]
MMSSEEKDVLCSNEGMEVEDEVKDEVLISLCESSDTCRDVLVGKNNNGETAIGINYKLPELLTISFTTGNMKNMRPVKQEERMSTTGTQQDCKDDTKVSNRYLGADEATIGIDESRTVRFKNNLFVAIEELRIQREEQIVKNNALLEQQTQIEIDLKKQQEDRLLHYEEEKVTGLQLS